MQVAGNGPNPTSLADLLAAAAAKVNAGAQQASQVASQAPPDTMGLGDRLRAAGSAALAGDFGGAYSQLAAPADFFGSQQVGQISNPTGDFVNNLLAFLTTANLNNPGVGANPLDVSNLEAQNQAFGQGLYDRYRHPLATAKEDPWGLTMDVAAGASVLGEALHGVSPVEQLAKLGTRLNEETGAIGRASVEGAGSRPGALPVGEGAYVTPPGGRPLGTGTPSLDEVATAERPIGPEPALLDRSGLTWPGPETPPETGGPILRGADPQEIAAGYADSTPFQSPPPAVPHGPAGGQDSLLASLSQEEADALINSFFDPNLENFDVGPMVKGLRDVPGETVDFTPGTYKFQTDLDNYIREMRLYQGEPGVIPETNQAFSPTLDISAEEAALIERQMGDQGIRSLMEAERGGAPTSKMIPQEGEFGLTPGEASMLDSPRVQGDNYFDLNNDRPLADASTSDTAYTTGAEASSLPAGQRENAISGTTLYQRGHDQAADWAARQILENGSDPMDLSALGIDRGTWGEYEYWLNKSHDATLKPAERSEAFAQAQAMVDRMFPEPIPGRNSLSPQDVLDYYGIGPSPETTVSSPLEDITPYSRPALGEVDSTLSNMINSRLQRIQNEGSGRWSDWDRANPDVKGAIAARKDAVAQAEQATGIDLPDQWVGTRRPTSLQGEIQRTAFEQPAPETTMSLADKIRNYQEPKPPAEPAVVSEADQATQSLIDTLRQRNPEAGAAVDRIGRGTREPGAPRDTTNFDYTRFGTDPRALPPIRSWETGGTVAPNPDAHAIAVVGSREGASPEAVQSYIESLPNDGSVVVVSGGAPGVDRIAAQAAKDRGIPVVEYPADWNNPKYITAAGKKRAGFVRNEVVVDQADEVVAFHANDSAGTADTIRKAKAAGKDVTINPTRDVQAEQAARGGLSNEAEAAAQTDFANRLMSEAPPNIEGLPGPGLPKGHGVVDSSRTQITSDNYVGEARPGEEFSWHDPKYFSRPNRGIYLGRDANNQLVFEITNGVGMQRRVARVDESLIGEGPWSAFHRTNPPEGAARPWSDVTPEDYYASEHPPGLSYEDAADTRTSLGNGRYQAVPPREPSGVQPEATVKPKTTMSRGGVRPEGSIYIGRAGKGEQGTFGNPFVPEGTTQAARSDTIAVPTVEQAVQFYDAWLRAKVTEDPAFAEKVKALSGKDLWYSGSKAGPSHGDVLAEVADELANGTFQPLEDTSILDVVAKMLRAKRGQR